MRCSSLRKCEKGVALIEFAVVFPLLFFVCFMTLLYLFWMGDAMLQTYAGLRFNQMTSKQHYLDENSPLYQEMLRLPSLNLFQNISYEESFLSLDMTNDLTVTECIFEDPLLPSQWLRLALLPDWNSRERFVRLRYTALGIQEPYLPSSFSLP